MFGPCCSMYYLVSFLRLYCFFLRCIIIFLALFFHAYHQIMQDVKLTFDSASIKQIPSAFTATKICLGRLLELRCWKNISHTQCYL